MTGLEIIKSAMRKIGALASGEQPTGDETTDGLTFLNQMIDDWNAERLMIFTIQRQVFVPAVLKQLYTVGTGGDFNIARPPKIEKISIINQPAATSPSELPLGEYDFQGWSQIPVKNLSAALSKAYWDDQQFPLRNVSFWPIPNVSVNFAFYTWTALSPFPLADTTVDVLLPPAYARAIVYNLAVDLASEFGGDPSRMPLVMANAAATKGRIKSMNIIVPILTCDPALVNPKGGSYNWLTDQPAGGR